MIWVVDVRGIRNELVVISPDAARLGRSPATTRLSGRNASYDRDPRHYRAPNRKLLKFGHVHT
jgi:hypothetical protein